MLFSVSNRLFIIIIIIIFILATHICVRGQQPQEQCAWSSTGLELYDDRYDGLKLELIDGVYDLCQLNDKFPAITYIYPKITLSDPFPTSIGYVEEIAGIHVVNDIISYKFNLIGGPLEYYETRDYVSPDESFAAEGVHQVYFLGNTWTYTIKACNNTNQLDNNDVRLIHEPSWSVWTFNMNVVYVCQYAESIAIDASRSLLSYYTPEFGQDDQIRFNHWINNEIVLKTKLTFWSSSSSDTGGGGGGEFRYDGYVRDDYEIDFSDPSFLAPGIHKIVIRAPKDSDQPVIRYEYRVVLCIS